MDIITIILMLVIIFLLYIVFKKEIIEYKNGFRWQKKKKNIVFNLDDSEHEPDNFSYDLSEISN